MSQGEVADASASISARIAALNDWRGETLSRVRRLIHEALPDVTEEWKWDTPVWSQAGVLCTGEIYKKAVKLTFARGASLPDPGGLFNASLQGKVRRAIDLPEGATLDEVALKTLMQQAAKANQDTSKGK